MMESKENQQLILPSLMSFASFFFHFLFVFDDDKMTKTT